MKAAATRRAAIEDQLVHSLPPDFVSRQVTLVRNGRPRGRSLVRGLPVQLAYAFIDALLVCASGVALLVLRSVLSPSLALNAGPLTVTARHAYTAFYLLYAAVVVMGCSSQDLYRTPRDRSAFDEGTAVAKAVSLATMILVVFIFISGYKDVSRLVIAASGVLNVFLLSGWRLIKRRVVLSRTAAGNGVSRILIAGAGGTGVALGDWLTANPHLGYHVCGYLDQDSSPRVNVLGNPKEFRHIAITQFVDELFITLPSDRQLVTQLALEAHKLRLGLKIFPDLYDGLGWRVPLHMIGGFPVMDLHWQPIPAFGLFAKRLCDIIVAGILSVLTVPVILLSAIAIRMESSGKAIYVANRVGLKGKTFPCYKLRTMIDNADAKKDELRNSNERNGPFFKMAADPRVTRIGRFLRKTSLDEIPQLWNVLRGDMSLVGPRPHPVDDVKLYSVEHLRRLDVRPGVTGLWQVSARSDPSFERNMMLDLEYIENWSFGLDLKILLRTIPAVFRGESW